MTKSKKINFGIIFPILLLFIAFWDINRGIDLLDSGYVAEIYQSFHNYEGKDVFSTFLAEWMGHLITLLPGGNYLIGIQFYCAFVPAAMAVMSFFFMRKYMDERIVFILEILALCTCWTPYIILYDYLTFLLLDAAVVLVLVGLKKNNAGYFIAAGICLGLNVLVRTSNLAEVMLIIVVWYGCFVLRENDDSGKCFRDILIRTVQCIAGWLVGIVAGMIVYLYYFDLLGTIQSIRHLQEISVAGAHSLENMLNAPFSQLASVIIYMLMLVAVVICFAALILRFRRAGRSVLARVSAVLCVIATIGVFVFFYRKGIFSTEYTGYASIFKIILLFYLWGVIVSIANMVISPDKDSRILGAAYLLVLYITPFGSDNYLMLDLDNMFLLAPFVVYGTQIFYQNIRGRLKAWDGDALAMMWPAHIVAGIFSLVFAVSCIGFGINYIYNDDEPETVMEGDNVLKYIRTTQERADGLNDLLDYFGENLKKTDKLLSFYGNPGYPALNYILQKQKALSTTWSELASYSNEQMEEDLETLQHKMDAGESSPAIIFGMGLAHYYQIYCESPETFDQSSVPWKAMFVYDFMYRNGYTEVYNNINYDELDKYDDELAIFLDRNLYFVYYNN